MKLNKKHQYLLVIDLILFVAVIVFGVLQIQKNGVLGVDSRQVEVIEIAPKIALTFDDGPHEIYTTQLLDGLLERGITCSFFVTGIHALEHPEIIQRMFEEGHLIGNHTYSHIELTTSNTDEFIQELDLTSETLYAILGEQIEYVRPPYGCWNERVEKEVNMLPVFWTVDPVDWNTTNVEQIVTRVVSNVKENDIILMHDYYATSVEAAFIIIDTLTEQGYEFVTVDQILLD